MVNKLYAMLFIAFCGLLFSHLSLAETNTKVTADGEAWHVQWVSQVSGPFKALWAKRNDRGEYYGLWNNGTTANLVISRTVYSFDGTAQMNSGDTCTFNGSVQANTFRGLYFCRGGDKGTLNGVIAIGMNPPK